MKLFQNTIFALSRAGAALACIVLVGMVAHILYEIVLRAFFASSTYVLDEFVGYGVAACTFLALGYSLEHGSLIRVDLLLGRLTGRARRAVDSFCAIATLWIVSVLIWYFWLMVERSWTRGRVSSSIAEVPLWIPQGAVLVGLGVLWLQLFAYLLRQAADAPPLVADDQATQREL